MGMNIDASLTAPGNPRFADKSQYFWKLQTASEARGVSHDIHPHNDAPDLTTKPISIDSENAPISLDTMINNANYALCKMNMSNKSFGKELLEK